LLYHVRRQATDLRLASPVNDLRQTELGASVETETAALAMAERILAAGSRAKMPTGTGTSKPLGLAAQIIAAGEKRRGLSGAA
jgi:hypothetical protein